MSTHYIFTKHLLRILISSSGKSLWILQYIRVLNLLSDHVLAQLSQCQPAIILFVMGEGGSNSTGGVGYSTAYSCLVTNAAMAISSQSLANEIDPRKCGINRKNRNLEKKAFNAKDRTDFQWIGCRR